MLPNYAYFEGKIVPYSEAKVGVATHALNYGTGAFAGVRAYWNEKENQLYIFRPDEHFTRFLNSAKLLLMDLGVTKEQLTQITVDLLRKEGFKQNVYVRPLAYKADEVIGVRLHDLKDAFTIFSIPFERYVKNDTGAHVTFSSWRRVDDNMIPARGKITGTYINSAFIKTDAANSGFDEALVLNVDGHISEGSAMNFFMVRDGVILTPPVTDNILEGITRNTAIELVQAELGVKVVERSIDRTEVYLADEIFLTGTAAQITAVTRVDHRPIGTGEMGPITAQLRDIFGDVVRGKLSNYRHWNYPVYE
ncbi:MAG TPA: branched-chain amino acid transaminase [Anaerolineales bacterium]|jgi:branched-chain amino acid aminotransferase|nr:branched-chain amino acid transaminase [Anaerolineales bacterium]